MTKKKKVSEKSAGFITFLEENGSYKVILLDHGKHISHPKGHIEKGESKREAAIRELKEETNLEVGKMSEQVVQTIKYQIEMRSKIISKTVYFFAAIVQPGEIKVSNEHKRYFKLVPGQANDTLTYESDRDALQGGLEWLEEITSAN